MCDDGYSRFNLHYGMVWDEKNKNDLKKALHVTGLSFNIKTNTKMHKTRDYKCTTNNKKLVVRRGGNFTLTLEFSRPFNLEADDIKLEFKTGDAHAMQNSCTNGQFLVDETRNKKLEANKWGGKLVKKDGSTATIDVHIAANCAIGNWTVAVKTVLMKDGKKREAIYNHEQDFSVLFNPWCKDDTTFMPADSDLDEYVLNDSGTVYQGNGWGVMGKAWNFSQFDEGVLEAALFLLDCLKEKVATRSNPIHVARNITRMCKGVFDSANQVLHPDPNASSAQLVKVFVKKASVAYDHTSSPCHIMYDDKVFITFKPKKVNANDDNGVIVGNWSGVYDDGTAPTKWYSSVDILEEYMKTKAPVKYGQCWVFSAVLTTLCRTLGLPARCVTNFNSAHDTDTSCTIDKYFTENGEEITEMNFDSIWVYHAWNEVWFKRPDVPPVAGHPEGCFDGWQVIDATPQERSNGIFTCGPSPLYAIKRGMVTIPYDTAFVYAEINGDVVHWIRLDGTFRVKKIEADAVGNYITTRNPEGGESLNLTVNYKFTNGSPDDIKAKSTAALGSQTFNADYLTYREKQKDICLKLMHEDVRLYGEDLVVCLNASHSAESKRKCVDLSGVAFKFYSQDNRGKLRGDPFLVAPQAKKTLKLTEECSLEVTLTYKDYRKNLHDGLCMSIHTVGHVIEGEKKVQLIAKRHDFTWKLPELKVEVPCSVKKGDEFKAIVKFENSLPETLQNCRLCFTNSRFIVGYESMLLEPIPGKGGFEVKYPLKAIKAKPKAPMLFTLMSNELTGVEGRKEMEIKKLK